MLESSTPSEPAVVEQTTLSGGEVIDRYFLENRARLLGLAAFLDRVDRSSEPDLGRGDFRYQALIRGIGILLNSQGSRAADVLLSLSDLSTEPIPAAGEKGAQGASREARS